MKIPRLRWIIAAMLCLATMINYADRLTLSVVSVDLRRQFELTEQDYSHIITLFMLSMVGLLVVFKVMPMLGTENQAVQASENVSDMGKTMAGIGEWLLPVAGILALGFLVFSKVRG
jgi:hypothetical protein